VPPRGAPELFDDLTASGPRRRRGARALAISLAVHAGTIAAALLLPLWIVEPLPEMRGQGLRVFFYQDPPPPPPPPLPLGVGLMARPLPGSARPIPPRETPALVAPSVPPAAEPPRDEMVSPDEAGGHPEGSVLGDAEGMEGGVVGGEVGGVPGGVVGGVIGGHGSGPLPEPVPHPDRLARPLLMTRPRYPHEAFTKKIEGTVVLEILIDEHGRVVRWRVVQSVSPLDAAAVEAVRSWLFVPASHQGRPVASLARAPISFRIY
jgi:periplasmic protein TonB